MSPAQFNASDLSAPPLDLNIGEGEPSENEEALELLWKMFLQLIIPFEAAHRYHKRLLSISSSPKFVAVRPSSRILCCTWLMGGLHGGLRDEFGPTRDDLH